MHEECFYRFLKIFLYFVVICFWFLGIFGDFWHEHGSSTQNGSKFVALSISILSTIKNHTAEYLCSENMFSSTFQWKQTIGMWYVVEECVNLKYANRVFGHVKPNYGSGLGVSGYT